MPRLRGYVGIRRSTLRQKSGNLAVAQDKVCRSFHADQVLGFEVAARGCLEIELLLPGRSAENKLAMPSKLRAWPGEPRGDDARTKSSTSSEVISMTGRDAPDRNKFFFDVALDLLPFALKRLHLPWLV